MGVKSVYVTRTIPEAGIAVLANAGLSVRSNPFARPLRPEELREEIARNDALVCQVSDRVDRAVIQAGKERCQIIANCATGVDNIDLTSAQEFGIVVTNTPDVLTESTADLAWALLMATARRLGEAERVVRAGAWRGWGMLDFLGTDVHGKTLGIIGGGRIGTAMARRATGFNMPLLYCSRRKSEGMESLGAKRKDLFDLLESSDFVSLHVPLSPETHHLISEQALGRMKRGAILINTARGAVIDQAALIVALREGQLTAAQRDGADAEPARAAPSLFKHADLCARERLRQVVEGRYRRAGQGRPVAC